jgi:hypothetical protein
MRCGAFALAVLIAAPWLVACGGARDATEKELAALHGELAKVRADQARTQERLDALEITRGALRGGEGASASTPTTKPIDPDRPDLDVVRLAPEADANDDTDADTPRPMVHAEGAGTAVVELRPKSIVDRGPKPKKKPGGEKNEKKKP